MTRGWRGRQQDGTQAPTVDVVVPAAAFVLAIAMAASPGCAHETTNPPAVVAAFATRVTHGEWNQAYALMSAGYRQRVPFETFRRQMEVERAMVNADAIAMMRLRLRLDGGSIPTTTAVVTTPQGDRVNTIFEGGTWALEDQPLTPFGQHSPRAALRTFIRAVELKRYDVLARLIPRRRRGGVTAASLRLYWEGAESSGHRAMLARLSAHLDEPVVVDANGEAYMPYGSAQDGNVGKDEGEVHFLFEDGVWRLDDIR